MHRLTSLAVVIALGACSAHTAGKVGMVVGGSIMGVGFLMQQHAFGYGGDTDPADVAFIPYTIGGLIAGSFLLVVLKTHDEAPPPPAPDPRVAQRGRDRAHAWELTKQAAAASRAGDCAIVVRLDPDVHVLDDDFYTSVFVHDLGISRCLATR